MRTRLPVPRGWKCRVPRSGMLRATMCPATPNRSRARRSDGRAGTQRSRSHLFTKPYTPRTNGKAERFIQTMTRRRAYKRPYRSSAVRTTALGKREAIGRRGACSLRGIYAKMHLRRP